jgi:predicted N-acetyltransferase YhbS
MPAARCSSRRVTVSSVRSSRHPPRPAQCGQQVGQLGGVVHPVRAHGSARGVDHHRGAGQRAGVRGRAAHRRLGAASSLWDAGVDLARGAGATSLYVSATPTGSAVGFYLSRGCQLADPVHPDLFAHEPDDIHLTYDLA